MLRILFAVIALLSATPAFAQSAAARTPDSLANAFFKGLQTGPALKAYNDMWQGTLMSKKQADVENAAAQTDNAFRIYGKLVDWEKMSTEQVSPSFIISTFLVRTEGAPIFFKMQFYHAPAGWMVAYVNLADSYKTLQ